jgi:hypothetical protein
VSVLTVFCVFSVGGLAQAYAVSMPRSGEIFETRWEATVLTVRWRLTDNQIHPCSTRAITRFFPRPGVPRRALRA